MKVLELPYHAVPTFVEEGSTIYSSRYRGHGFGEEGKHHFIQLYNDLQYHHTNYHC